MSPFQSTRPARGATVLMPLDVFADVISIHAPREGRDIISSILYIIEDISIHAPREGRDHQRV